MNRFNYYSESTIPGIFRNRVFFHGDETFLKQKRNGSWTSISWNEVASKVDAMASFLINAGIKPGDKIAIYSENRPEWVFADLAILSAGAADVTVYPTNSAPEAAHIIKDSDTRICFCSGEFQVKNLVSVLGELPLLEKIISFDDIASPEPKVTTLKKVMERGSATLNREEIDSRIRSIDPASVMTIMYTSGTTGNPKGVMLSANNIVAEVLHFVVHQPHPKKETALSILPLSHALERSIGYYLILYNGGTIAYCRGPQHLLEDLVDIRPTCFISVPRIPEKIYEGILAKVSKAPALKRALFGWAAGAGKKAAPYLDREAPLPGLLKVRYRLADRLVLSKMRAAIGMDRLSCLGTGGAPFGNDIHNFFSGIGIKILPGYGLTETAPVTHSHTHTNISPIKPGSVGQALPMTECKIADDGEILLRGPQLMMGYYKNEKATAEVFNADGFFMTGDIGHIDGDGYLYITDRKKDLIITAGGKNVAPQVIEGLLTASPLIEQASLIGDQRKFITALIVPDFANLADWARQNGVTDTAHQSLVQNEKVKKHYDAILEDVNRELGRVEQVKKYTLLTEPFTQEKGELTPTLKIKRKAVQKNYSDFIEAMYKES